MQCFDQQAWSKMLESTNRLAHHCSPCRPNVPEGDYGKWNEERNQVVRRIRHESKATAASFHHAWVETINETAV